jgi:predicted metalloprotease
VLLVVACGGSDRSAATASAPPLDSSPSRSAPEARPRLDLSTIDPSRRAVISDLQRYWADKVTEQTARSFRPLPDANLFPFDERTLPPTCEAAKRVTYEQLRGNAFFCPSNEYVAWDEGELFPRLDRQIGPAASKLVLAHEWGHAVQHQLAVAGAPIALELQADCFAGMWIGESAARAGLIPEDDWAQALAGLLQLSDQLDVPPNDPAAHGSPFDRTVAFRDGLENRTCFDYAEHPPVVAALDIVDDEPTPPLSYEDALADLVGALNAHHRADPSFEAVHDLRPFDRSQAPQAACGTETQVAQVVARFNFWLCPSQHFVLYDEQYLRRVFDGMGVGGLATALAVQWDGLAAGFEEHAPGFSNLAGIPFRECHAGAFLAQTAGAPTTRFHVSLAELNGAVGYVLLQPDRADPGTPTLLTAFFALRFLENGVRHGAGSCASGS